MKTQKATLNFGAKGWWIIVYAFFCFVVADALSIAGLNTIIPAMAGQVGVDESMLLSLSTPISIVGVFVAYALINLGYRIGLIKVQLCALVIGGIGAIIWGNAMNLALFVIGMLIVVCCMNTALMIGGNILINNWFPKKRGVAVGIASMGMNVSSAFSAAIMTGIAAAFGGIKFALAGFGVFVVIWGIVTKAAVHSYPEECGAYPDNDPSSTGADEITMRTGWTTKKLLSTGSTWIIGIANGLQGMCIVGFVAQLIPILMSRQVTLEMALTVMMVASLIGAVGSFIWGWLDTKFGTKPTAVAYSIYVAVGCAMYLLPGTVPHSLFLIILASSLGGVNNFFTSSIAQIYGRTGSGAAISVINIIMSCVRFLCYAVHGLSLAMTGSFTMSFAIFAAAGVVAGILFGTLNMTTKQDPAYTE